MKEIFRAIQQFLHSQFSLAEGKEKDEIVIESIRENSSFKGTNLWTLIFAILIASIGLNVNSPAVIIGAMLISPLMGPIMGIGLGIGILDFGLMKKGIKNLGTAALFSIITSFLYFSISPLQEATSEILARTKPSTWDVLIAFFGGMAGIIAETRKQKGNAIPGVAIATALMPPLCTAGFGLATHQYYYFFGALYLFFINGLFICLSAFIIVRYLKFPRTHYASEAQQKRVIRTIVVISLLTIVPSIYLTVKIVQRSIFEENAKRFVHQEFRFSRTQVVHQAFKYDNKMPSIRLLLIGDVISQQSIDSIRRRMPLYRLDSNGLTVQQGPNVEKEIDLARMQSNMQQVLFLSNTADSLRKVAEKAGNDFPDIKSELLALYPHLKRYSLAHTIVQHVQNTRPDTITVFIGTFAKTMSAVEKARLSNWVVRRTGVDSVKSIIEYEK